MFKRKIFWQIIVTSIIALSFSRDAQANAIVIPDDEKWVDYDNYIVINQDTTWRGDVVFTDQYKDIVVVDGATLTIEGGAHIELASRLDVYLGRIVAEGTAENNIVFTTTSQDKLQLPAGYNPACSGPIFGGIEFDDYSWLYGMEPSVMRFVEFKSLGAHANLDRSGACSIGGVALNNLKNALFPVAQAAVTYLDIYFPAIRFREGNLRIENSNFSNNRFADIEVDVTYQDSWDFNTRLDVVDSNFENNAQNVGLVSHVKKYIDDNGNFEPNKTVVNLKNNWYNNSAGPKTVTNQFVTGEELEGDYTLDGWSAKRFENTISGGASNVLFLPGLESSRLYANGSLGIENQLWEPNRDADAEKLYLDANGKSLDDSIYTRDVVDEANVLLVGQSNIYISFLHDLAKWKNEEKIINDYAAIPYDWRLSLEDILNSGTVDQDGNISYAQKSADPYIIKELRRLASTSRSKKVTIVAHSNGGLVAKAMTNKLGAEAENLIDEIVFVATPQVGTPQAVGGLLHGFEQGLPKDWMPFFLSPKIARTLANNMPGAYNLLPTEAYLTGTGSGTSTPIITFENGTLTQSWIDTYGNEIDNSAELYAFLKDENKKISSDSDMLTIPSIINSQLLDSSKNVHQALDSNWTVSDAISVYQIAGFGEETLSGIKYWTGTECLEVVKDNCVSYRDKLQYSPEMVIDGDGTVVAPSALAMNNAKRYWVDLFDYNDTHINIKHADILEVQQLRDLIKGNILTKTETSLPKYISDAVPVYSSSIERLQYILHSPLALSVQDANGHAVSASSSAIPGATFRRFGEVQYISIPANIPHTVVLTGLSAGSFTLEMQEMKDETVVAETVFAGIPTSDKTKVTMEVADGTIQGASPLEIDYDGDNAVDYSLQPKVGETVLLPPVDQTPPEALIKFNPNTQRVDIIGKDDASSNVSVEIAAQPVVKTKNLHSKKIREWFAGWIKKSQNRNSKNIFVATLTDEAGNATNLVFVKTKDLKNRVFIELKSIAYNGFEVSLDGARVQYKWQLNHQKQFNQMATHIQTASVSLEAHYISKKNQTWLMERPLDLRDDDSDDNSERRPVQKKLDGLVIPSLETNQGSVNVKY